MSSTKVIVIGCGIAGPVLATFLKLKGYEPIIYERIQDNGDPGISLMLQTNGLQVLSLVPGLVDKISGKIVEQLSYYSILPEDTSILVESDLPAQVCKRYGHGLMGVQRAKFLRLLVETAEEHGVLVKWGHKLVSLEQYDDVVKVTFENGSTDTASFVVGCDGLHSNTRISLFGKEQADFTGLTQMGGVSPASSGLPKLPTMVNILGNGEHMITYPISDTHYSWAISQREDETKETWRAMTTTMQDQIKSGPFSKWGFGAGELVKNAERIVKFGLYDRPALKTWYKGRVVLLGDAAHPTSPHLGQGANQAFEDIYHLIRTLVKHNPDASAPSTAQLSAAFAEYEGIRLPRSAQLVKGAREMGETRVVAGVEQCKKRNDALRATWRNQESMIDAYGATLGELFKGGSEI